MWAVCKQRRWWKLTILEQLLICVNSMTNSSDGRQWRLNCGRRGWCRCGMWGIFRRSTGETEQQEEQKMQQRVKTFLKGESSAGKRSQGTVKVSKTEKRQPVRRVYSHQHLHVRTCGREWRKQPQRDMAEVYVGCYDSTKKLRLTFMWGNGVKGAESISLINAKLSLTSGEEPAMGHTGIFWGEY